MDCHVKNLFCTLRTELFHLCDGNNSQLSSSLIFGSKRSMPSDTCAFSRGPNVIVVLFVGRSDVIDNLSTYRIDRRAIERRGAYIKADTVLEACASLSLFRQPTVEDRHRPVRNNCYFLRSATKLTARCTGTCSVNRSASSLPPWSCRKLPRPRQTAHRLQLAFQ